MKKIYKISTIILISFVFINLNVWATTTSYGNFSDTGINYTSVDGATKTGEGNNQTVALPIREFYLGSSSTADPTFEVKSEEAVNAKVFSNYSDSSSYNSSGETRFYELGEESSSEHFLISYHGATNWWGYFYNFTHMWNSSFYLDIYYLPNFYSNLDGNRDKKTNIDITMHAKLSYLANSQYIYTFGSVFENKKSYLRHPYDSSEYYNFSRYLIQVPSSYVEINNFLEFYFTWNTTTLKSVNDYSKTHNNGYQFVGHEPVYSYVIFNVTAR